MINSIEEEVERDIVNYEQMTDNSYTDDINLFKGLHEAVESNGKRSPYELLYYIMSL